jgi:hypothetical protein
MELWCDIFNENLPQLGTGLRRAGVAVQNVHYVAVENPMRSVDEYRRSAASMLDLAQKQIALPTKIAFWSWQRCG